MSAVKRVEFVSDRMSYITLRGRWCNIIVLNVHAPTEDNIKMDLREIGWDGMDWIDLAQDRDRWRAFMNMVVNLWVP
jgi:hypothetical protein